MACGGGKGPLGNSAANQGAIWLGEYSQRGRVAFNIGGNKYRLILAMDYERQTCYVKFVGTHLQYDAIAAESV